MPPFTEPRCFALCGYGQHTGSPKSMSFPVCGGVRSGFRESRGQSGQRNIQGALRVAWPGAEEAHSPWSVPLLPDLRGSWLQGQAMVMHVERDMQAASETTLRPGAPASEPEGSSLTLKCEQVGGGVSMVENTSFLIPVQVGTRTFITSVQLCMCVCVCLCLCLEK